MWILHQKSNQNLIIFGRKIQIWKNVNLSEFYSFLAGKFKNGIINQNFVHFWREYSNASKYFYFSMRHLYKNVDKEKNWNLIANCTLTTARNKINNTKISSKKKGTARAQKIIAKKRITKRNRSIATYLERKNLNWELYDNFDLTIWTISWCPFRWAIINAVYAWLSPLRSSSLVFKSILS